MTIRPVKQIFTVLGCSSSPGVPRTNGDWGACDPLNPKNKRRRASLLIEQYADNGEKTTIVVDTGPDFREQMLSANVTNIDAVIYTHPHADHIHGIDDLRSFAQSSKKRIDIYSNDYTIDHLSTAFGYVIDTPSGSAYPPIVDAHRITNMDDELVINGPGGAISLQLIDQVHGQIRSIGLRVGKFAYCCDVNEFPEQSVSKLQNLDVLIIDATLMTPHVSHFSLDQAVEWIDRLGAKKAYTTHMHTPLDYEVVLAQTPEHIEPAYDGLQIEQTL